MERLTMFAIFEVPAEAGLRKTKAFDADQVLMIEPGSDDYPYTDERSVLCIRNDVGYDRYRVFGSFQDTVDKVNAAKS